MQGTVPLREAVAADAPALAELKLATFRETFLEGFAIPYPPADLAHFEAENYGLAKIEAELADTTHRTWVIEASDRPGYLIAYAHVGPCKLPHEDVSAGEMELYQIYLRREAQGAGLGKALLAQALGHIEQAVPGGRIWLGVWSGNVKAQAMYAKHGFVAVGGYQFAVGTWRDDELILRRDPQK